MCNISPDRNVFDIREQLRLQFDHLDQRYSDFMGKKNVNHFVISFKLIKNN